MATQPCPGIAQVDVIMSDDGEKVQNGFHVYRGSEGLWPLTDLVTLTGAVHTWWANHMKPLLPPTTALVEIKATDLTSLAGQIYQEPANPEDVGTNADGAPLPNNVTAAIKFIVAERGRGVAGRMFWPQMVSTQISAGSFLTGAFEAAAIVAMGYLKTAISEAVAGASLTVLSRFFEGVKRAAGVPKAVQGFAFSDNTVDSSKDRLPGHKKHRKPRHI